MLDTLNFKSAEVPTSTETDLEFYSEWVGANNTDKNRDHIIKCIRDVKSKFHTYKCIQDMMFLYPTAHKLYGYSELLNTFKKKKTIKIADIGCCFGQDIRKMILDGIPSHMIYAIDVHDGYWKAGLTLFQDQPQIEIDNSGNSVFDSESKSVPISRKSLPPLPPVQDITGVSTYFNDMTIPLIIHSNHEPSRPHGLNNNIIFLEDFDYILVQTVFHCISYQQCEILLQNVMTMLKPEYVVVFGSCVGSEIAREWALTPDGQNTRYLHSISSLTDIFLKLGYQDIRVTSCGDIKLSPPSSKDSSSSSSSSINSSNNSSSTSSNSNTSRSSSSDNVKDITSPYEELIKLQFYARKA